MAARRLLIVMLILLGVSTLAAALIPQRTLRDGKGTQTTTQATTTTTQTGSAPAYLPPTKIIVGGKKLPVVSPVHVGDQLTLLVRSRVPASITIPEFGQLGFATLQAPARFELLAQTPGTFGILFADSGDVAAKIRVVKPGQKPAEPKKARSRARGGSGRA